MLPSSFMNKSNNKLSLSLGQHWPLSSYLELVLCLNRSSSSWTLSVVSMIHRKWTWSAVDASLFVRPGRESLLHFHWFLQHGEAVEQNRPWVWSEPLTNFPSGCPFAAVAVQVRLGSAAHRLQPVPLVLSPHVSLRCVELLVQLLPNLFQAKQICLAKNLNF